MPGRVVQINFRFSISPAELAEDFAPLAEPIAQVAGMRWKIWSLNAAESEFAGIYLFDDAESAQAYMEGPIIAQVVKHPALSEISAKQFDVIDEYSAITRGPV
jgi:hypothetical protein